MKNAITNYENTFYLNGSALSGILSVDGSYNLEYQPINVIGKGFLKQIMASVPKANLSVSRYLVNYDPAFNLTGNGINNLSRSAQGGLYYEGKYFGFQNGHLNSLGISCSVGEVPQVQTSFDIFGNIGPNFNPSGSYDAGGVFVPQVKNIVLNCRNSSTNRITQFNIDYSFGKDPIYGLSQSNSEIPIEVHNVYPIEVTASFNLEIDDYETKQAFADLTADGTTNFSINISGAILENLPLTNSTGSNDFLRTSTGSNILYSYLTNEIGIPIFNFSASDAIIISEQINSTAEDVMSVNLSYKTYLN
jgi:hypothetical protein